MAPPSDDSELDVPAEGDGPAFALGDLMGEGGLDLGSLMQTASQMQAQMAAAQEAAAATVFEGAAGGGAVRIEVTGTGEFRSVRIDPAAVDPSDVGMLEDLVLAALHDAAAQIEAMQAQSMGGFGDLLDGVG